VLTAKRTTRSKNAGVHPKRVGFSAMSWVAKISQPPLISFAMIRALSRRRNRPCLLEKKSER